MIRGRTISLRPLDRQHVERTRTWTNDPELARLMDRARPVTESEHERWFASLAGRQDCAFLAIETNADARHIGNVWLWGIDRRHRKAELRIVIGEPDMQSRGAGSEAISMICQHAFEHLDLHRVFAYVLVTNPRARRSFEKAGFAVEGTLRDDRRADDRYTDVWLLARLR